MKLSYLSLPASDFKRLPAMTSREDIETIVFADQLGFEEAWMPETYTLPAEPITSSMMLLSRLAELTRQIKLAATVALRPNSRPAVLAGQAALLHHLTRGRFIFGIDVGGIEEMGAAFEPTAPIERVPPHEPRLDLRAKPSSDTGVARFWREAGPVEALNVPIAISASKPHSGLIRLAARRGWIPVSANCIAPWKVRTHWDTYCEELTGLGRPPDAGIWHVTRTIHVADTDAQAEVDRAGSSARRAGHADAAVIHGVPVSVARQILELRDDVGPFGTLLMASATGLEVGAVRRSMELMITQVMPAVNAAIGAETHTSAQRARPAGEVRRSDAWRAVCRPPGARPARAGEEHGSA